MIEQGDAAPQASPERADDERRSALERHAAVNAPTALAAQLATALRFLTVVPIGGASVPLGQGALFFPAVGLGLGALLVVVDRALAAAFTPESLHALVLVSTWAAFTGAAHLRALARGVEELRAGDGGRASTVVPKAALGALAVALVLGCKIGSLAVLPPERRVAGLLVAPMLARWAMVVLAFGSRPGDAGVGAEMTTSTRFREFGLATVSALWVALAWTGARGLTAVVTIAVVTIGCRVLAHRRRGGVTGDLLGAIVELSEALVLGVFALGPSPSVALA